MIDIIRLAELVPGDHGLTVVALALPDRTVHAPNAITSEATHAPPSSCASAAVGRQSRDRSSWPAQATR